MDVKSEIRALKARLDKMEVAIDNEANRITATNDNLTRAIERIDAGLPPEKESARGWRTRLYDEKLTGCEIGESRTIDVPEGRKDTNVQSGIPDWAARQKQKFKTILAPGKIIAVRVE